MIGWPRLEIVTSESKDDYLTERERHLTRYQARSQFIDALSKSITASHTGFCAVCSRRSTFDVVRDPVRGTPLWRESFACKRCGFNTRLRAFIHMYSADLRGEVYITEQVTPLYRWLLKRIGHLHGSEFLRGMMPGEVNQEAIRNEDLTGLSFESNSFDRVLSFEVLEHIPDYRSALAEMLRCLKPRGRLILSAPFIWNLPETLTRASILPSGEIAHHMPPDYHGNPLDPNGSLCYYYFSFDLLDAMREVGFANVRVHEYWSKGYVYLGMANQTYITAEKP